MADDESTKAALLASIEEHLKMVSKIGGTYGRVQVIKDLALAYRYVVGGEQPATTTVSSKS